MSLPFSTSHMKQVFTYPFEDPRWKNKFLIGILITLACLIIPVLPALILYGYLYQIMHRILVGDGELHLPEWDDWGKLFKDGWRLFCVYFIYTLPMMLVYIVGMGIYFIGMFSLTINAETSSKGMFIVPMLICVGILYLSMGIAMVLGICTSIMLPPAICHTVRKESFAAAFDFSGWWQVLKANPVGFFLAIVIIYGLGAVLMVISQVLYVTIVCCCLMYVVLIVGGFYLSLVTAALIPLVYKESIEKLNKADATVLAG